MGRGGNSNPSAGAVVTRAAATSVKVEELRRRGLQESRLTAPRVVGDNMFSLIKSKSSNGAWQVVEISPDEAAVLRTPLGYDGDDISQVEAAYERFLASARPKGL